MFSQHLLRSNLAVNETQKIAVSDKQRGQGCCQRKATDKSELLAGPTKGIRSSHAAVWWTPRCPRMGLWFPEFLPPLSHPRLPGTDWQATLICRHWGQVFSKVLQLNLSRSLDAPLFTPHCQNHRLQRLSWDETGGWDKRPSVSSTVASWATYSSKSKPLTLRLPAHTAHRQGRPGGWMSERLDSSLSSASDSLCLASWCLHLENELALP